MRTNEIKNELNEITGWEDKIKRNNLKYGKKKCIYDFQQFKMLRSFGENIISGKITISKPDEDQSNLLEKIVEFNKNLDQEQKNVR